MDEVAGRAARQIQKTRIPHAPADRRWATGRVCIESGEELASLWCNAEESRANEVAVPDKITCRRKSVTASPRHHGAHGESFSYLQSGSLSGVRARCPAVVHPAQADPYDAGVIAGGDL